jgi:hypothetical protein
MYTSLRELRGYSRVARLLLVVVVLVCLIVRVYYEGFTSVYSLIYALFTIPVLLGNSILVFLLSLAIGFITASLESTALLLLSTIVALLGLLVLYLEAPGKVFNIAAASLLASTPIYIAAPISLVPALSTGGVLLLFTIREYLRLGRSAVEVYAEQSTMYIGEPVKYKVVASCPGSFRYSVLEESKSVSSGVASGEIALEIPSRVEHLGVIEKNIRVVLEDTRGFARVTHGPYTLTYKILARVSGLIKRAEKLVEKYAEYLSTPRVVKITLGHGFEGSIGETASTLGAGPKGTGDLGSGATGRGEEVTAVRQSTLSIESTKLPAKPRVESGLELKQAIMKALVGKIQAAILYYASKAQRGDYSGVREYEPGDNPKLIHWKKSLRRELLEDLYVKIYSAEQVGGGGGAGARVILADLTAVNPVELDTLLSALYGELLYELAGEKPLTRVHLFLKIPGEELIYVSGKVVDVVVALNTIIQEYDVRALYNYETWGRTRSIKLGESIGFISELENYYRTVGLAIAEVLKSNTGGKTAVQLIHSNSLGYKYAIVKRTLRDAGFMVLET